MKLNEFVGIDHPSDKLTLDHLGIKQMLERVTEIDTDAFLYVYKCLMGNLPMMAAERALDRKFGVLPGWDLHPMYGIASVECKDFWAVAYQRTQQLADKVFDILVERANAQ